MSPGAIDPCRLRIFGGRCGRRVVICLCRSRAGRGKLFAEIPDQGLKISFRLLCRDGSSLCMEHCAGLTVQAALRPLKECGIPPSGRADFPRTRAFRQGRDGRVRCHSAGIVLLGSRKAFGAAFAVSAAGVTLGEGPGTVLPRKSREPLGLAPESLRADHGDSESMAEGAFPISPIRQGSAGPLFIAPIVRKPLGWPSCRE
jgi:hypothetical protein